MPRIAAILFGGLIFALSACAPPPITSQADLKPLASGNALSVRIPAAIGAVELGYDPLNVGAGIFLREALRETMEETGAFSPEAPRYMNFMIVHMVVNSDLVALAFEATVTARYRVTDEAGIIIQTSGHTTTGVAQFSDSPIGGVRQDIAVRRAMKANLAEFRDTFLQKAARVKENAAENSKPVPERPSSMLNKPEA